MRVESILIDSQGFLSVERIPGKMKPCFCPIASPNMTIRCGDWCPHFNEPVFHGTQDGIPIGELHLTCQSGTSFKATIKDERGGN